MSEHCHIAVAKHLEYLSTAFTCTDNGEFQGIVTPYTYSDADSIELFVKERGPGSLTLTDLGGALDHAALSCGRDLMASHDDKVKQIATKLGLMLVDDELIALCSYEDVGSAMLRMAMAAKEVESLARLARANRIAKFDQRFGAMLTSRGVHFLPRQKVAGASGFEYTVDFISKTPKPALIQTVSVEQGMDKIARVGMAFSDLRDVNDPRPKFAVVERVLSQPKMRLLRKNADEVFTQAEVDEMLGDLGVKVG